MRVVFRADASLEIGTGHVVRCLTLADALRERGCECIFVSRELPGALLDAVRQRGHACVALPRSEAVDWRADALATRGAIGPRADWLVVDHYALDAAWQRELRGSCTRLMVIDDLADREHDCELLLDQNLVAAFEQRYDGKVPAGCGLMLGPAYALLQPAYAELHSKVAVRRGPIERALVYFGGADPENLTEQTIEAFLAVDAGVEVDVVINAADPRAEAIRHRTAGHPRITLHASLPSLAPLMARADVAVGAGGATTWERCWLRLPSVVVALGDNQKPIAAELAKRGLIEWLGHGDEVGVAELTAAIRALLAEGANEQRSRRVRELVDGRGAERVSAIMLLDSQTALRARAARSSDEELILAWANDALVRRHAFKPDPIPAAEHRVWFGNRLNEADACRLYVIETAEALPIGQVRFQRDGDYWEIHYSLDARARGRGLARPLLATALEALRSTAPEAVVFGRVKAANAASARVFEGLGFSAHAESHGIILYRRPI